MKNVIVIGGGPSGMMAAGIAAGRGHRVFLMEKNKRLGIKLAITGKGRCNLTNASDPEELLAHTMGNPHFLYSAFYTFGSERTMAFFEELGVPLVVERGKRVFPRSEKAGDIVRAMEQFLKKNHVDVHTDCAVRSVVTSKGGVPGVETRQGFVAAERVVVATGGLSYPATGSTGDGFRFAKTAGHAVTKLYPSLTPMRAHEKWVADLQGLSLKNIAVTLRCGRKKLYEDFGEMLFTHDGVSGPVILSASRLALDQYQHRPTLSIDLKPALDEKELDNRILRDFEKYKNKDFRNALDDLLPQKMIPAMVSLSNIPPEKKVHDVTRDERKGLVRLLKNLELTLTGSAGFQEAVVTCGGVCVDAVNPATMESRIVGGLYFTGEVLDVDALTGGFNLQIAFSTGYLAGMSV